MTSIACQRLTNQQRSLRQAWSLTLSASCVGLVGRHRCHPRRPDRLIVELVGFHAAPQAISPKHRKLDRGTRRSRLISHPTKGEPCKLPQQQDPGTEGGNNRATAERVRVSSKDSSLKKLRYRRGLRDTLHRANHGTGRVRISLPFLGRDNTDPASSRPPTSSSKSIAANLLFSLKARLLCL